MANTKSAKKMTRKIAVATEVNKMRRSRMRTYLRKVEERSPPATAPRQPRPFAPPSRS
jgi:small subunit ribosomal protein S20